MVPVIIGIEVILELRVGLSFVISKLSEKVTAGGIREGHSWRKTKKKKE